MKDIEKYGIPNGDLYNLPTSKKTFNDGDRYKIEISGIERLSSLKAMIDEKRKRDIPVHRVIGTVMGSTFLDDNELKQYLELANS